MNKRKIIILISIILISLITFYRLCRPGYFSMMDDMHVFRLQQFDQCLHDGQIPCRFISDGGMGYGYPLFNYYSPLPYSIAEGFHLIGFSFINSLKITFASCHLIGVLGMFLFASLFWGETGAAISSIIFLLAPYQATDSWVRGAIAESLAINIIPWIFYFLTQFINHKKNKLFLIISLASLFLSHNLISLAIAPVLLIYSIILLLKNKNLNLKSLFRLTIPVLLSLGLSAFFVLPAIFEKNLVTVDTMTQGYFNYVNHFATLNQLFISRFWGYGASLWGPIDDMAFSVGLIQWLLPLISIILIIFNKHKKNSLSIIFFFLVFLFSLFLTHNKSTFIWKLFPFMPYFQFPWRFLSIAIFAASFISGSIVLLIKKKFQTIILIIIALLTIILNFSYFKEDIWYPNLTDKEKLSTENIIVSSGAGLKDYWPKFGKNFPNSFSTQNPVVLKGKVDFIKFYKNSHSAQAYLSVNSDNAVFNLPMVYFPNWELKINGQNRDFQIDPDLGLIQLNLTSGQYSLELKFKNTPIRILANYLSLASLILFAIMIVKKKNEK